MSKSSYVNNVRHTPTKVDNLFKIKQIALKIQLFVILNFLSNVIVYIYTRVVFGGNYGQ